MKPDILTSTFLRIRDRLRSVATSVTGDRDEAEDTLQEVFLKLWSRRLPISDNKEAEMLLNTSVRNASIDHLRKKKPTPDSETVEMLSDTMADENDGEGEENTQDVYDRVVAMARQRLNDKQFHVFDLHDIQGMSYLQIAQELSMTEENVRVTLSRARKTIRELYRQNGSYME